MILAASMARIAQERDGSRTPFDKAPERARAVLPAAPHVPGGVRGTDGRGGARSSRRARRALIVRRRAPTDTAAHRWK